MHGPGEQYQQGLHQCPLFPAVSFGGKIAGFPQAVRQLWAVGQIGQRGQNRLHLRLSRPQFRHVSRLLIDREPLIFCEPGTPLPLAGGHQFRQPPPLGQGAGAGRRKFFHGFQPGKRGFGAHLGHLTGRHPHQGHCLLGRIPALGAVPRMRKAQRLLQGCPGFREGFRDQRGQLRLQRTAGEGGTLRSFHMAQPLVPAGQHRHQQPGHPGLMIVQVQQQAPHGLSLRTLGFDPGQGGLGRYLIQGRWIAGYSRMLSQSRAQRGLPGQGGAKGIDGLNAQAPGGFQQVPALLAVPLQYRPGPAPLQLDMHRL